MKIISKRKAMALYRQHPQSRLFRFCTLGSCGYVYLAIYPTPPVAQPAGE